MAEPSRVLGKIAIQSLTINIFSLKDAIYKFLWFVSFALKFIAIRFLPTIKGQMWSIFMIFSIVGGLIVLKNSKMSFPFMILSRGFCPNPIERLSAKRHHRPIPKP